MHRKHIRPHAPGHTSVHIDYTPMKRRRVSLFLSQAQVAKAAGLSTLSVLRIENNQSDPSHSAFLSIAQVLGVPAHELYEVVA